MTEEKKEPEDEEWEVYTCPYWSFLSGNCSHPKRVRLECCQDHTTCYLTVNEEGK